MFVCWVRTGATLVVNELISSVAYLWDAAISLLPDMPDAPTMPVQIDQAVWLLHQVVDVPWLVSYITYYLGVFLVLLGVMIALRWAKGVE